MINSHFADELFAKPLCPSRPPAKIAANVRGVSIAALLLACACGNDGVDPGGDSSGGKGPESGGSANAGSGGRSNGGSGSANPGSVGGSGGDGGESSSGSATQGSGGDREPPEKCKMVDGKLAYGRIGEPWPLLPVSAISSSRWVELASGFRTGPGYGFVFFEDSGSPFSLNVDSNFQPLEPAVPLTDSPMWDFDISPAPNGFIAALCSRESEPEWIQLDNELIALDEQTLFAPDAPCGLSAPRVLWTGEVYLTSFTDARGLVVASLDEQGTLISEQILSEEVEEVVKTYFSKSGDRVLVAFNKEREGQGWYRILDLQGTPVGDVQPIGEEGYSSWSASVVASGDGWWVLGDYQADNDVGAMLTGISRDGSVWQESRVLSEAVWPGTFVPSAHGGSLLVTSWSELSLSAHNYAVVALIDDTGAVVYSEDTVVFESTELWPVGIVLDPHRDLVIEEKQIEGSEPTLIVQEYGCLE